MVAVRVCSFDITFRDVGVAGSNPVTQTIDFVSFFQPPSAYGSRAKKFTVPKTVPVSTRKNHLMVWLSLNASGRIQVKGAIATVSFVTVASP
jgi:hypothetical protein